MSPPDFTDPRTTGLYPLFPGQAATLAASAQRRYIQADLGPSGNLKQALHLLGQLLDLPDWYGANLDALHDCLCDPSWRGEHGCVIALHGTAGLRRKARDGFSNLLDVLRSATETQPGVDTPLWILIDELPARPDPLDRN